MKQFIQKISERQDLTRDEAASAMRLIMEGQATDAQISAFLIGLKMKDETPQELLGFVEVMREKSFKVKLDDTNAIDMCGTGGDGSQTFNISTVASFVVAGCGVTVAKHGNRSISSSCGSADVLKALGVNIELPPEKVEACINNIGIGFLFAPLFHPAMKFAAKPRAELGVKTCFNMLGPLTNPAGVRRQLVGAFSHHAASKIADVFQQLRPKHVCVISSDDKLDEVSLDTNTRVWEVSQSPDISFYILNPVSFGLSQSTIQNIQGSNAETNASIAKNILDGEHGAYQNYVVANAAMGLYVAGKVATPQEGVPLAQESINSGRALEKLKQLIEFSNR